ncbi:MAG TPA: hemolysin family protein [Candidatus Dormibacteraeota bacterium]|jgi:putative hemolysin|nr:hemolysin family protein [Candidatus Dormibacteraeota bacterium]
MNYSWFYAIGVVLLALFLPVFSYLTLIYRELGRMTTGPVHEHLDIFEAEIEPKLRINRRSAGRAFRILGHFWLAFLVLETTRGVLFFVTGTWEALLELSVFIALEVVVAMHFIPDLLLYRTTGRWLLPLLPAIRASLWLVWPFRVFVEGAETLARISEKEMEKTEEQRTEEGIEALVEAAEEEGIIEPEQADLIEQVVEFSDKRVREVMTPRPDIVAISADTTLEELHAKFVETGFTRIPAYEKSLDDIVGVAHSQDMLTIADTDLPRRKVRELMKPVLFIPETKVGSELLKEMRQKGQTLAVVIDEHGSVAGIATMEDLVEEIMGESGDDTANAISEIVKESDGAVVLPGGLSIAEVEELLGVQFGENSAETVTTIAGLLSHASGKVPAPGDKIDLEGYRFEVLDANQTKVLRVRIRKVAAPAPVPVKTKAKTKT